MNKRSRILGILGAAVLTLGVAGIALAIELKDEHQGITVSWDSEGNAVIEDADGNDVTGQLLSTDACGDLDEGEVVFHFVQSGGGQENPVTPNPGGTAANTIDVDFEDEGDVTGWAADDVKDNNVDWFVSVDASDGEVTLVTADSNVNGGELRLSHVCVGEAPETTTTTTTSFSQTESGTTTTSSTTSSSTTSTETTSTSTSFSQTQSGTTTTSVNTSFSQTQSGTITQPDTATLDGNGTSKGPDAMWLLVAALGALFGGAVVMFPGRAKIRR